MYQLVFVIEREGRPSYTARRKAESKVRARELKSKLLSRNIKEGKTIYSRFRLFDEIEKRTVIHDF